MKNIVRLVTTLGAAAVLAGIVSLVPAQAQDFHVRHDVIDVRRDERRLDDLNALRRREADHHDWHAVARTDREISDLRFRLNRDRRDFREDIHHDGDHHHFDR